MTHLMADQRSGLKMLQTCLTAVISALATGTTAGFSYVSLMILLAALTAYLTPHEL